MQRDQKKYESLVAYWLRKGCAGILVFVMLFSITVGLRSPAWGIEGEPTNPTQATSVTEATDATDATEATDAADATDSTEATDATDATNSTEATDATQSTDAAEVTEATEATQTTESTESTEATDATDATEATDSTNVKLTAPRSNNQGSVWDYLTGDFAYVCNLRMKPNEGVPEGMDPATVPTQLIRTGTEPFDADNEAGNDADPFNNIVRTFDTVTYHFLFDTRLRQKVSDDNCGGISEGRLYFQFIVEGDANEIMFDTGNMLWLGTAKDCNHETISIERGDVSYQVLRGSFVLQPIDNNPSAIGASTNELYLILRVLQMQHKEFFAPEITLWLQHNDVGITYDPTDYRLPEGIVTGRTEVAAPDINSLPEPENPAVTITTEEVRTSARAMFNVAIADRDTRCTRLGSFDFDAAVPGTINYGLGVIEGRLNGYGLQLELLGKEKQGMRGALFPNEDVPITFQVNLSSFFDPAGDEEIREVKNYTPLFWNGSANLDGNQGIPYRAPGTQTDYIATTAFNKLFGENSLVAHASCFDGGKWSFTQSGNTLSVTVSGFDFNTSHFPYGNIGGGVTGNKFYNPSQVTNYWDITKAVFSTGELWIVQPYVSLGSDNYGQHITEEFGSDGMFKTTVEVSNLKVTCFDPNAKSEDCNPNDNIQNDGIYLRRPGSMCVALAYLKPDTRTWDNALTPGGFSNDLDWTTAGSRVTLEAFVSHDGAEDIFTGVGYDLLVKFDDEFFIPDLDGDHYAQSASTDGLWARILWAGLPGGRGWTSDDHMKKPLLMIWSTTPLCRK